VLLWRIEGKKITDGKSLDYEQVIAGRRSNQTAPFSGFTIGRFQIDRHDPRRCGEPTGNTGNGIGPSVSIRGQSSI